MRLEGKVALITGAAHGMGAEEARLFAREGAKVVIADIREDDARKVEAEISEAGGESMVIMLDVSQEDQWQTSVAAIVARFGRLDILVNNAGISGSGERDSGSTEAWDRLMDINVKSAFLVCRRAVREMSDNGGGSIVITGSIASELGYALESLYCMTKGAVLQLMRTISTEYRDQGIRCNAVCPGFVNTAHGLREIAELDAAGQEWEDGDLAATQGRICEPEEVTAAVIFLASDEASFVNGTAVYVDNGWYAKG